ncbi:unnamed protein product [Peniophora sp. CBMAI 1063]|nr:unnamed protein product [Peniophora sp. CBMAI 1063]
MSAVSSEAGEYEYESELNSLHVPTGRPWKYLEHPDDDEWMRGPSETQTWPNLGDFVILSLNPIASVRHLDAAAQEAARQIPVRKFVAAAIETVGLPVKDKALHPFDYLFVRQRKPSPRFAGRDPDEECVAILPNDTLLGARDPVRPAHPLPWSDCYFDLTWGFPFECRSSNIEHDYFPVLPMDDDELVRVQGYVQESFSYVRERFGADRPDPLSFVDASTDVPPTSARAVASSHTLSSDPGRPNTHSFTEKTGQQGDDVSVIASEDHVGADGPLISDSESDADSEELDMLLRFEAMMNDQGDPQDPVVDTWYDLDMVTEVLNPVLFLQDVKRLRAIMNDAEARMRAQVTTTAGVASTDGVLEGDRNPKGTSADASPRAQVGAAPEPQVASTVTPAESLPSNMSLNRKSCRMKSLTIKLTYFAKKHVRRLLHSDASDGRTGSSVS